MSDEQLKTPKRVIARVVRALQKSEFKSHVGIEVTEVFKGGSMGQGTTVPGHYDIDLVLYSRSLDIATVVKNDGYGDYLEKINDYLSRHLQSLKYRFSSFSKVAVKFECTKPFGGTIEVDLLLSPQWGGHDHYLSSLPSIEPPIKRMLFSAGSSKWQTDFIKKEQLDRVRELIKRGKAWRNKEWEHTKEGRPKSYLMSILVITAFQQIPVMVQTRRRKCKPAAIATSQKMKKLVAQIKQQGTRGNLDLRIPGGIDPQRYRNLLPPPPRIVDPVNPANNLYLSGVGPVDAGGRWDIFAAKIRSFDISITAERMMKI